MTLAARLLASTNSQPDYDPALLVECIEAGLECAQSCSSCANLCLSEPDVERLRACINTCLDCADVCVATAQVLSRWLHSDEALSRGVVEACRIACGRCATECEGHAHHHEHCRICAEACRRCEQACEALLA
jgi:hypothetical protein